MFDLNILWRQNGKRLFRAVCDALQDRGFAFGFASNERRTMHRTTYWLDIGNNAASGTYSDSR
jgi:hypothetical protein